MPRYLILSVLLLSSFCWASRWAYADSIPAEEIEVPPPTWSVFYVPKEEVPLPPVLLDTPHDFNTMTPILLKDGPSTTTTTASTGGGAPPIVPVVVPPINYCWLPWFCDNNDDNDDGNNRKPRTPKHPPYVPPDKPKNPPGAPVPEPTAIVIFGVVLGILTKYKIR